MIMIALILILALLVTITTMMITCARRAAGDAAQAARVALAPPKFSAAGAARWPQRCGAPA